MKFPDSSIAWYSSLPGNKKSGFFFPSVFACVSNFKENSSNILDKCNSKDFPALAFLRFVKECAKLMKLSKSVIFDLIISNSRFSKMENNSYSFETHCFNTLLTLVLFNAIFSLAKTAISSVLGKLGNSENNFVRLSSTSCFLGKYKLPGKMLVSAINISISSSEDKTKAWNNKSL